MIRNVVEAARVLSQAIGRADAELLAFASARPAVEFSPRHAVLAAKNMRRRAWLGVLQAKLIRSPVSIARAGDRYQRTIRDYPADPVAPEPQV